ncbi:MutS-related protein [Clostridium weizhouense]|uniref:DNA mismatch repair protein MutS n=1 Tax=Clostridium weizhouense TaxID=2859781 RepID=A0ABS7AJL4_9CLOT|nr:MutS family DNA mismatch repair protein [Clostridium weizhouense]MBW6408846.1 DNA mismatch repair protein MutS [Clostridium weizhouense]
MDISKKFYEDKIAENVKTSNILLKQINIISWSRLIILILMLLIDYLLYKNGEYTSLIVSSIMFISGFIGVVIYHSNKLEAKKRSDIIININKRGLDRLSGEFKKFKDNGSEYLDENNPFINDLNVFGQNSIFQFINSTVTKGGRERLVNILGLKEEVNKKSIVNKQFAIKELADKVEWRQKFILEGSMRKSSDRAIRELIGWGKKGNSIKFISVIISYTFIFVNFVSILLSLMNILPLSFILLVFMIDFIVIKMLTKNMIEDINLFNDIKNDVKEYSEILSLIENETFESEHLKELKDKLINNQVSSKIEMKKISNLLDWIGDSSYNAVYFVLNVLVFSDVFIMRKLDLWKNKNGKYLEKWLDVMNEFDALSSISNLAFDYKNWSYPIILDNSYICGEDIAHPLLGEKAIKNNFSIKNSEKVALITGSNMSGKSTFLRTLGSNLVLSYIGAPVCAKEFSCGIMKIYTCITTRDNLEENISSFYAEILRIKILIEACKKEEKVFFLLDEIFKGTNSKDRHTGAIVLIKQLIKYGGIGLVSTHDLELCDLEKEDDRIINYNFREFYKDNKINFDYKLRQGKSETQNAIHLMKLAGIELS